MTRRGNQSGRPGRDGRVRPQIPLELVGVDPDGAVHLRCGAGRRVRVDLLGVRPGPQAASALRARIEGSLTLSFDDAHWSSGQGGLLAYVYASDGEMLNEWALREGIGRAEGRRPHRLHAWFVRLEGEAKRRGRGLWADLAAETQ